MSGQLPQAIVAIEYHRTGIQTDQQLDDWVLRP
jgi:hypothetical protein